MVRRKLMGLLVGSLVLGMVSLSWAGVPDVDMCVMSTTAGSQVSVMSTPQGLGMPLSACMAFPGVQDVDATVMLTVNDEFGDPIFAYPYSDMWIESSAKALAVCAGGSTADRDTDILGQTVFSDELFAGGVGSGLIIKINGQALPQAPLNYLFNSPDISGDKVVNLTDFTLFVDAYFGGYIYGADLFWDGNINLSDLVFFADAYLQDCP